jgi:MYXO-CTERM domain-containing protein
MAGQGSPAAMENPPAGPSMEQPPPMQATGEQPAPKSADGGGCSASGAPHAHLASLAFALALAGLLVRRRRGRMNNHPF